MEEGETPKVKDIAPTKEKLSYQPKISVVIPVLNRVNELPRILKSLKEQIYQGEVEIIVADAGSTDGSVELCKERGVNVISAPQEGGIGATRRVGCGATTGEIILNTDSDCSLSPSHLEAIAQTFSNPAVIASHGPVEYTYKGKPAKGVVKKFIQKWLSRDQKKRHEKGQPMLTGPNFAILKSVYETLGGFDPRTHRIEEPVLYQLLWEMPGEIAYVENQKVQTELPWQEGGKPSYKKFKAYQRKNQAWVQTAVEVIRERKKDLQTMRGKVEQIVQDRRDRLTKKTLIEK